jgi:membrane-bound ClpP family serine protease
MEVCRGLKGPDLDLILHSPGGSPEATASVVRYLRQKFTHIRVFVPIAAMSAATMWALACDEIVMGKHSQLGPIDPQIVMPQGAFPARAIIRQFERARDECAQDPTSLGAWVPILQQYGPALLQFCEDAQVLARRLVIEWSAQYMFAARDDRAEKAAEVAEYFAAYEEHRSHALGIDRETAQELGLVIRNLEEDQDLQDAVLSVHHATVHTFTGTGARKIVENHLGRAFIQISAQVSMQALLQPPPAV